MKKIIILVAAVMIFGLGTVTNADAWCDPMNQFQDTNGYSCIEVNLNCGVYDAIGGSQKYVRVNIDNYSCDTTLDLRAVQYSIMGNANAAVGGTLGGDFKVWGPYKKATSGTVPVADCVGFTPGTKQVAFYAGDPMPAELSGSYADVMIDIINAAGEYEDDADCAIYVQ